MKRLLTLLMLVLLTSAAIAQDRITISGKVLDKGNGDPLIGVNIVEQGTTNGTISDIDGKFSLSVTKNATVLISYIGYKAQEFVANSEKEIKILLEEDLAAV
ncbi:MAG: carboxypeptidase-like regulatory domain-containing protein, partial [Bacteroidales bacterium]|nr:carboxypeptidase-like regulatory domain-containing protein [Bacteroidales bacterium]